MCKVPNDGLNNQSGQPIPNALNTMGTSSNNYPAFDLGKFWTEQMHLADVFESDFKNHPLPLARIKKVMKTDQEVKVNITKNACFC